MRFLRPLLTLATLFVVLLLSLTAATPSTPQATTSVGDLLVVLVPIWLPLAGMGLLAALLTGGRAGLRASLRFLLGREREAEGRLVQRTLSSASRTMVSGGLFVSLLAATCVYLMVGEVLRGGSSPAPRDAANLVSWTLMPAVFALGVGRVLCGMGADRAAVLAGTPGRRTYSGRDDLLLLLFLLPPVLSLSAMFLKADTL